MNNRLHTVEETRALVREGRTLLLAGDEAMLRELPAGKWIGGTIPYFMTEQGGTFRRDRLFVTELPPEAGPATIRTYAEAELPSIVEDEPANGFSVVILPASSRSHLSFARHAPGYKDIYLRPLIGWIAGSAVEEIGHAVPKVYDGTRAAALEDGAVVMHVPLPKDRVARVDIVNVFAQGDGDTLTFPEPGFEVTTCLVNGKPTNFADYLAQKGIDTRLPLVGDYSGAMINTSFQRIDQATRRVHLYAPVFEGISYKIARPVADYSAEFTRAVAQRSVEPVFSCNCILNYLYSSLEGKRTGKMVGPITFGEIAYQLVNQTLAYLTIERAGR